MAVRTSAGRSAAYRGAQVVLPGSITHVTKSRGESGVSAWPITATGPSPARQVRCSSCSPPDDHARSHAVLPRGRQREATP
jgi:hypothetical protein